MGQRNRDGVTKKLAVRKETLRQLTTDELVHAVGGGVGRRTYKCSQKPTAPTVDCP